MALKRFFTKDNLDVLREMALMQVVINSLAVTRVHRFLGLVKPGPSANHIIRRAWMIAEHLGAELDLLWVAPPHRADDPETERRVDDLRRLAAVFGAHLMVETDHSVAEVVRRVAARCGSTFIVMGTPRPHPRFGHRGRSLVDEIVSGDPALDIVLISSPRPGPGDVP